jgi:tetratricopeptide (TPR) repeat protein
MSSRRPIILMGVLLVLLLGYVWWSGSPPWYSAGDGSPPSEPPPLPGKNTVSGLTVKQAKEGMWVASFDYNYTGEPRSVYMQYELTPQHVQLTGSAPPTIKGFIKPPRRGTHHMDVEVSYPSGGGVTRQIAVSIHSAGPGSVVVASQRIDQLIDWPSWHEWVHDQQLAVFSPQENLQRAVALIDSGQEMELSEARAILEKLIGQNPQFDSPYAQLARIAMKTNWGPEGLHQAENLLSSALQIRPDSADSKILLGYVYSHQHRYAKAETMFVAAANAKSTNPWLWANWAEMLAIQGKNDQAIAKYRQAIALPITHDSYDRGRADAYSHLLTLLAQRNDLDAMEALYKQRVVEFGPGSCYSSDYARFLLRERGDSQGAIDLARGALHQNCEDSPARQVLGLALYVKWAATESPQRAAALNEARIYLPAGPIPLYLLAKSARTAPAAKQLIGTGENIDQRDNNKMTALAYALQNRDFAAANRLLTLGAQWDAPVGFANVPVALIPVMEGDIEAVRMLRKAGVDYSKLHYQGATAIDVAEQAGNAPMVDALGGKSSVL